jgi:hypothetical protein
MKKHRNEKISKCKYIEHFKISKKHRNLKIYDFNKLNQILHFYSCKKYLQTFQERKKEKIARKLN